MATLKPQLVAVERCLICTPVGRDAELLLDRFGRENITAAAFPTLETLAGSFEPAVDRLIILAEEALLPNGMRALYGRLKQQPAWSEVPIILFTAAGHRVSEQGNRLWELFQGTGDITMLERPLRVQTLFSTVRTALRARQRQYQIRDLLLQREADARSLREARDMLERRVQDRTAELTIANVQLLREVEERTRAENALRQLSQRTVQLQDEERRRIARELHDSVGQSLASIAMTVAALGNRLQADFRPGVEEILKQVDVCVKDVRTISHLLHPPLLDEMGLWSALEWYVSEFSKRSQIHVDLEMPSEFDRMKREVETAIFRIVQESLTNIHRHSGAQAARISLETDGHIVKMAVSDRGRGISQDALSRISAGQSGVGVTGMRERVKQLNGMFRIHSDHSGTQILVEIPLTN